MIIELVSQQNHGGGLVFAGRSFIVCFPAAQGERTRASITRSLFARPKSFIRSTRGAWLGEPPHNVDPHANNVGTWNHLMPHSPFNNTVLGE